MYDNTGRPTLVLQDFWVYFRYVEKVLRGKTLIVSDLTSPIIASAEEGVQCVS